MPASEDINEQTSGLNKNTPSANESNLTTGNTRQDNSKTALEDGLFDNDDDEFTQNNYNSNDVATNTGATEDTLDAAFNSALGVTRGNSLSGSNRSDFYESKSQGKSDAQEESDELNSADEQTHNNV